MNESLELARFASELRYEKLPREVVAKAKDLILDQIGIMMGVSTMPWSRIIFDYVKDWGDSKPEATVAHYGYKTKAENAVFANASFGHGFEIDDLYVRGSSHPGCVTVPSALAMAEREGASGKDVILAVVAGYEVTGRINTTITPSSQLRGFHSATSVSGTFGAAAAAGRILGFDTDLMLNAIAIAGSHSAGVTEYDQGGGSVKRMHAGMAAHGGVRSALLAQKGLTGPGTIIEGKHGFCHSFADEYDLSHITDKLGTEYPVVMGSGFKAYCACAGMHSGIDALRELKARYTFRADDVAEIVMGTNRRSIHHVEAKPVDITSAQFSAAFGLALTMIRGSNGFKDYTDETVHDRNILKLADKIKMEVDRECDSEYPKTRAARVTVTLKNGEKLATKVDYCKGTPQNPMTRDEFEGKFRGLAASVADRERIDQILKTVYALDEQKDVSALIKLMSSPAR